MKDHHNNSEWLTQHLRHAKSAAKLLTKDVEIGAA
jgi:hypothetical protein